MKLFYLKLKTTLETVVTKVRDISNIFTNIMETAVALSTYSIATGRTVHHWQPPYHTGNINSNTDNTPTTLTPHVHH